jgi:hypothetical protein
MGDITHVYEYMGDITHVYEYMGDITHVYEYMGDITTCIAPYVDTLSQNIFHPGPHRVV